MNRKGFTLSETLAIIIVIALLGLITIPAINKSLDKNQKKAFGETVKSIAEAVKISRANDDFTDENKTYDIVNDENIEYEKKSKIKSGKIQVQDGNYIADNITNGEYCANGSIDNLTITDGDCEDTE